MNQPAVGETTEVGKVQKSIQFPQDLFKLVEELEHRYGAKVNRQALAAFLQFLLSHPDGPDTFWVRMAVGVEKGQIQIADVPMLAAEAAIKDAEDYMDAIKGSPVENVHVAARRNLADKKGMRSRLRKIARDGEHPTIDDIIEHWKAADKSPRPAFDDEGTEATEPTEPTDSAK